MKQAIKISLFIGVTVSSIVLLILRLIGLNRLIFMLILYLYPIVGVLTVFFVYKEIVKKDKRLIEEKNPNLTLTKEKRILDEIKINTKIAQNRMNLENELISLSNDCNFLIDSGLSKMNLKVLTIEEVTNKNTQK